jgi:hypothetical protein
VITVGGGRHNNVGEGVFDSRGDTVIRSVRDDTGNSGKGDESLREGSQALWVAQKIARPYNDVGVKLGEFANPGNRGAMPGRHMNVTEMQNPDGLTARVQNGEGLTAYPKVFALHECAPGGRSHSEGPQSGQGEPRFRDH